MKRLTDAQIYGIGKDLDLALKQLEIDGDATHIMITSYALQARILDPADRESVSILHSEQIQNSIVETKYGSTIGNPTHTRYSTSTVINQLVNLLARGERVLTMGEIVREIEKGDNQ